MYTGFHIKFKQSKCFKIKNYQFTHWKNTIKSLKIVDVFYLPF